MSITLHIITLVFSYIAVILLYTSVISLVLYPLTNFWKLKMGTVYIAKYMIIIVACILSSMTITVKTPYL